MGWIFFFYISSLVFGVLHNKKCSLNIGVRKPRSAVQVLSILMSKNTGSGECNEFCVFLLDDTQRFTLYWCHYIVFESHW